MSMDIPPWNAFQFVIISTYTCFMSYFIAPQGGLTVVAVYASLLVLTIPAVFVQLKLGGYLQRGLVGVFSMFFPIWKGVGIAALIDLLLIVSTFAPIVAQLGTYSFISISSHPYKWGSCDDFMLPSAVNPEKCSVDFTRDYTSRAESSLHRPEELFYKREFLQMSPGIETIGGFPQWRFTDLARKAGISLMPVTLAIVWVLVFLFVGFGPRICGWILFLMGPAALACLLTTLGYGYHHLDTDKAISYLKQHYTFREEKGDLVLAWMAGFRILTYTFPMWTAIGCTMGKLCGRSRKIRNLSWLMLVVVFFLLSQLPTLAMAPYIGNLINNKDNPDIMTYAPGLGRLMWQMPAAFTTLDIPPAYAFVFFLSAFLFCLMFLCVGLLTLVDNVMDALRNWMDRQACSKTVVHLLLTFVMMLLAQGIGMVQTTMAGHYYYILMLQSMDKLRFGLILLMGLGLIIVYIKQNFGLSERILMGVWFTVSTFVCAALWLYNLYKDYEQTEARVKYDFISKPVSGYFPPNWTYVSWAIAAFPFVGVFLGAIHAIFTACKSSASKCSKLCCGVTERVREQNGDEFTPPLLAPEPTAPPYMYSYMEGSHNGAAGAYPMDHYKLDYSPSELEPLTHGDRSTRI